MVLFVWFSCALGGRNSNSDFLSCGVLVGSLETSNPCCLSYETSNHHGLDDLLSSPYLDSFISQRPSVTIPMAWQTGRSHGQCHLEILSLATSLQPLWGKNLDSTDYELRLLHAGLFLGFALRSHPPIPYLQAFLFPVPLYYRLYGFCS
jgi:hypothetical protein